jgi:plasmid maintenance system killer protein
MVQGESKPSGLRFKRLQTTSALYSARVNDSYRVLGLLEGDEITWFWIGTHADYERFLATL